jgi:hypothetical protein
MAGFRIFCVCIKRMKSAAWLLLPLRAFAAVRLVGLTVFLFTFQYVRAETVTVTNLADAGAGSLRAAIASASPQSTIVFDPGLFEGALPKTIDLTETLVVSKSLVIVGPGESKLEISGGGDVRVFQLNRPDDAPITRVEMRDLAIVKGLANAGGGGGGIQVGRGVDLLLERCELRENRAEADYSWGYGEVFTGDESYEDDQTYGQGGAIHGRAGSRVELVECILTQNRGETGAALDSEGVTIVRRSRIVGNGVIDSELWSVGGGLSFSWPWSAEYDPSWIEPEPRHYVEDTEISGNSASIAGGIASYARTTLVRTLVAGNTASEVGGGIYVGDAVVTIESSTLSGNTAAEGAGAYLTNSFEGPSNTEVVVRASTIAENTASEQGAGVHARRSPTTVKFVGSILARNRIVPSEGAVVPQDIFTESEPTIVSEGYNIVQADPTEVWPSGAPGDQLGGDPLIASLADNGGPTRTHALTPGSPAIDAGDPDFGGDLSTSDQRGQPRVAGGRADIGAFEAAGAGSAPTVVCPLPLVLECSGGGAVGELTFQVADADGDIVEIRWFVNGEPAGSDSTYTEAGGTPTEVIFGALFSAGVSNVRIEVEDGTGTSVASCEVTVTVNDNVAPVVTLNGDPAPTIEAGQPYVLPGATALDACAGELDVSIAGALDANTPGIYLVTYTAVDPSGRSASATRTITVVDTTAPVLTVLEVERVFAITSAETCGATINGFAGITAADGVDSNPTFSFERLDASEEWVPVILPRSFEAGSHSLRVSAVDLYGNASAPQYFTIVVSDQAAPQITLLGEAVITLPLGAAFVDPGATAFDACEGEVAVFADDFVNTCLPGSYSVSYYAYDSAENFASATRTVIVQSTLGIEAPESLAFDVVPGQCFVPIDLREIVAVSGLATSCSEDLLVQMLVRPAGSEDSAFVPIGAHSFAVGTTEVTVRVVTYDDTYASFGLSEQSFEYEYEPELVVLAEASFEVVVSDPYLSCLNNVAWPLAFEFPLAPLPGDGDVNLGVVQQFIAQAGEARWYKFNVVPGARVTVTLTDLPSNYDLVVYSDIQDAYDQLLGLVNSPSEADQLLALLGAEFAPEAYSPEAYSPEAYSPEAYSPEAYSPEAYSPEAYSPEAYSPEAYSPEAYSPEAYSPEAYSPEAYSPEAYSPEAYSPEAYASAQARSLVGFSAGPGTGGETVQFNTYSRTGVFYVRVRGQNGIFSTAQPFTVAVQIEQDVCKEVTDFSVTPTSTPVVAGSPTSLIVWDSTRLEGDAAQITALRTTLNTFATAASAVVVDVSTDARIAALNTQADANPACPAAKNLVGEAIRNLIRGYRAAAPSIADVTLVGPDAAIPFFRTNDEALLASEANYFPPVFDDTHSQSALRFAQVLTQDRYGSNCEVVLSTGPLDLPEIPVGRLVESAVEIEAYLARYTRLFDGTVSTGGVLPTPASGFVSGYDFLDDGAEAVRGEFAAGLGSTGIVDTLIAAATVAPANGWTAEDLRTALFSRPFDMVYLAGHFSTSGTLAADYRTRFTATELAASSVDFEYAFFMSTGCHSGYNTVNRHAVPGVTEQPDWAQAFARKFAVWVAGTGYQYGDTDFVEYSERLYVELARALRTGNGPVSVGRALVDAKLRYLEGTPIMRGIHEKSLVQATLYGLPMVKLALPGERLTPSTESSGVTATTAVGGVGSTFALQVGNLVVEPTFVLTNSSLDVIGTGGTVVASYLRGGDGVVTLPAEPVRPLEAIGISNPVGLPRGVGFRGGLYTDLAAFLPLTGAPATEIRGVHGAFLSEVFFPVRPWNVNHIGLFCGNSGGSVLNVFPAQYLSDGPAATTGTMRRHDRMEFSIYYSPNRSADALANPPAINVVSSELDGADVVFSVDAAAALSVGVQEVWVTYTGLPGSPDHGRWQSLSLTPPATTDGIGTWTGRLVGAASRAAEMRYFVQAVNGVGVVALNSNFGRFFEVPSSTLDAVGRITVPTSLSFLDPVPSSGAYRERVTVRSRLLDDQGAPIVGRRVTFRLGSQTASAPTDSSGTAQASLLLALEPGSYTLDTSFAGDADSGASSVGVPFLVSAMGTLLEFGNAATVGGPEEIFALLRALDGTPLKEKTIVFVVTGPGGTFAISEITNFAGEARFSRGDFPPGPYEVRAFFGQPVAIPGGQVVPLSDPLYGSANASANVTVGGAPLGLIISREKVTVHYNDLKAKNATRDNRGHSQTIFLGRLELDDPAADPDVILSSPVARHVTVGLEAILSDRALVNGDLRLAISRWSDRQWAGAGKVGDTRVLLHIGWKPPVFKIAGPGPKIEATSFVDRFTILEYKPVAGTYTTVIRSGAKVVTVEVKNGRVTKIDGGVKARCGIHRQGRDATVALPFVISAGDTFVTTGSVQASVTAIPGVNFFGAHGSFQLVIDTPSKHGPLYCDPPATLSLRMTLGTGTGETPVTGTSTIGEGGKPWSRDRNNSRQRF